MCRSTGYILHPDAKHMRRQCTTVYDQVTQRDHGHPDGTVLPDRRQSPVELKGLVSVLDSGGGPRRLRDEYGIPARGDARQCLAALAATDDEAATMRRALFTYRVHGGRTLAGHNLGNLFI